MDWKRFGQETGKEISWMRFAGMLHLMQFNLFLIIKVYDPE